MLTAFAEGRNWEPMSVPLRGPTPGEIAGRLAEVQEWAAEWARADRGPLRVEYKKVGGRQVGANLIPGRAWIDGYEQAWQLIGAKAEVRRFRSLTDATAGCTGRFAPMPFRTTPNSKSCLGCAAPPIRPSPISRGCGRNFPRFGCA